jgi:hypothetical protein
MWMLQKEGVAMAFSLRLGRFLELAMEGRFEIIKMVLPASCLQLDECWRSVTRHWQNVFRFLSL